MSVRESVASLKERGLSRRDVSTRKIRTEHGSLCGRPHPQRL